MSATPQPMVRELGAGRPVLVVHGGMSDESPWLRVAETLARRFLVIMLRRLLYRLDLAAPADVTPGVTMGDQVAEVLAVAEAYGPSCVIVGHSSGAILALEALAARPELFAGGICYEPPCPLPGLPLGEPTSVARTQAAIAAGRPGRALQIFLREGVRIPAAVGLLAPAMALLPEVRRFVPAQIDDFAIVERGVRSSAYARIPRPVWFLTGERSPAHLRERCVRLAATLPYGGLVTLPGTGHGANQTHPRQLGELVGDLADRLVSS